MELLVYIVGILGSSPGSNALFDITADCLQLRWKGQFTAGAAQLSWMLTLLTWLTVLGLLVDGLQNQDISSIRLKGAVTAAETFPQITPATSKR